MMDTRFTSHRGFSEQLRRNVAFQRPADPVERVIDGGFEPVFPHVAPSVQEEAPVGFDLGELYLVDPDVPGKCKWQHCFAGK